MSSLAFCAEADITYAVIAIDYSSTNSIAKVVHTISTTAIDLTANSIFLLVR